LRIVCLRVGEHVANLIELADLIKRRVLGLLKLRALGRESIAVKDNSNGRG
jgi:hypothetical protein